MVRPMPFSEEGDRLYGATSKIRWSYAVCKTLEETLCLGYALEGLPVTIVRYFNIYIQERKMVHMQE